MNILALIGLSACGKTLISNILQGNYDRSLLNEEVIEELKKITRFSKYTTSTTRKPRLNEIDEVDYYFYDRDVFVQKIKNNEFIEYAEVYGNLYGLTKEEVEKKAKSNTPIVLIMDPQGIETISKQQKVTRIFIDVSIDTIIKRMKTSRNECKKIISDRISNIEYFYDYKKKCEYIIDGNKDINIVMLEIIKIIKEASYM